MNATGRHNAEWNKPDRKIQYALIFGELKFKNGLKQSKNKKNQNKNTCMYQYFQSLSNFNTHIKLIDKNVILLDFRDP